MPLIKSKSARAFKSNVRTLMREIGKSPHVQSRAQALKIAYEIKRRGKKRGGPIGYAEGGAAQSDLDDPFLRAAIRQREAVRPELGRREGRATELVEQYGRYIPAGMATGLGLRLAAQNLPPILSTVGTAAAAFPPIVEGINDWADRSRAAHEPPTMNYESKFGKLPQSANVEDTRGVPRSVMDTYRDWYGAPIKDVLQSIEADRNPEAYRAKYYHPGLQGDLAQQAGTSDLDTLYDEKMRGRKGYAGGGDVDEIAEMQAAREAAAEALRRRMVGAKPSEISPELGTQLKGAAAGFADPFGLPSWAIGQYSPETRDMIRGAREDAPIASLLGSAALPGSAAMAPLTVPYRALSAASRAAPALTAGVGAGALALTPSEAGERQMTLRQLDWLERQKEGRARKNEAERLASDLQWKANVGTPEMLGKLYPTLTPEDRAKAWGAATPAAARAKVNEYTQFSELSQQLKLPVDVVKSMKPEEVQARLREMESAERLRGPFREAHPFWNAATYGLEAAGPLAALALRQRQAGGLGDLASQWRGAVGRGSEATKLAPVNQSLAELRAAEGLWNKRAGETPGGMAKNFAKDASLVGAAGMTGMATPYVAPFIDTRRLSPEDRGYKEAMAYLDSPETLKGSLLTGGLGAGATMLGLKGGSMAFKRPSAPIIEHEGTMARLLERQRAMKAAARREAASAESDAIPIHRAIEGQSPLASRKPLALASPEEQALHEALLSSTLAGGREPLGIPRAWPIERNSGGHVNDPALAAAARVRRANGGEVGMPQVDDPGPLHEGPVVSDVPGRTDQHNIRVRAGSYVLPSSHVASLAQDNTIGGFSVLDKMFAKKTAPGSIGAMHGLRGPNRKRRADGGMIADDNEVMQMQNEPKFDLSQFMNGERLDFGRASAHFATELKQRENDAPIPIVVAGGEYVLNPEQVMQVGGGDIKHGHEILDAWVKRGRKEHIATLKRLPGPAKT